MSCHPDIIDASERWALQTVLPLRLRLLCCRLVVWTGIAFSCIGYLLVWAGADGKIAMPFGLMVVLSMLISDGSSWVDTAATTVSLDNFPHHKGYITGEHPPGMVTACTACRTCSLARHMLHCAGVCPCYTALICLTLLTRTRSALCFHQNPFLRALVANFSTTSHATM